LRAIRQNGPAVRLTDQCEARETALGAVRDAERPVSIVASTLSSAPLGPRKRKETTASR
jgi:hypothetical protein